MVSMRGLDLTKVNKEIWDGCPLLPRGPPETSAALQPPTPCDLESVLSDSADELSGSGFNSSGDSTNKARLSLLSDLSDDNSAGHSRELSLTELPQRENFPRMESQSSRIPLPGGTAPAQKKTPEPLLEVPRDWASILRQDTPPPASPRPTGIPRPQGKIPRKPREAKTRIKKPARRLLSPQTLVPKYPTPQTTNSPKSNEPPSFIPRLNLPQAAADNHDDEHSEMGYGSMRLDSTYGYSADELSQVSSPPRSEMPSEIHSEIPSEILAEMASELPSEIPFMESKQTPRSVASSKFMPQDREEANSENSNYHEDENAHHELESVDDEDEEEEEEEQNGVLGGGIGQGSPYLQGMGYSENQFYGSMHAFRGSEGDETPYLRGTRCSDGDLESSGDDFDGREGLDVEEEVREVEQPGGQWSDAGEQSSEHQWEWSDQNPQPSDEYDFEEEKALEEEYNSIDDWRKRRLQYAEQTSEEEAAESGEEGQDLQPPPFEEQQCGDADSAIEKECVVLWENSSGLANIPRLAPHSFDQKNEPSAAEMQKGAALQVSIDLSKGVNDMVSGSTFLAGVLPLEAPFQEGKNQGGQEGDGASKITNLVEEAVGPNEPMTENCFSKIATFVEVAVGPDEPMSEEALASPPVDVIFASPAEDDTTTTTPGGVEGSPLLPVSGAENDLLEKSCCSDGDLLEHQKKKEHQEAIEKENRVDEAAVSTRASNRSIKRYIPIIAVCATILVMVAFLLWWSGLTSTVIRVECKMPDLDPTVSIDPRTPLQNYNSSSPNIIDIDADDTIDNDTRCDADGIDGMQLEGNESGEGVNNKSSSLTIERDSMKLQEVWPGLSRGFLPRSFLGWIKFVEQICGGLVSFWMLLF
ncbi:hypothetical protein BSKO_03546 [Bryopsis sp. KO-2023]|nr:hypothetical protein BSKO_03546 [Bryopsis sp. KO-2023]